MNLNHKVGALKFIYGLCWCPKKRKSPRTTEQLVHFEKFNKWVVCKRKTRGGGMKVAYGWPRPGWELFELRSEGGTRRLDVTAI